MPQIAYLGIRHHGPGSARRVLDRLETLRPGTVLIEGPADLSDHLAALAHPSMVPPVALLAYGEKMPESASFWPMAIYSPEYQAALWALRNGVVLRFIDLPVSHRFETEAAADEAASPVLVQARLRDPFTELGRLAGYEDGESYWNDLFEASAGEDEVFAAIETAVTALREGEDLSAFEARREAHMRLEITAAAKQTDEPVAVICGAWHVPALRAKHPSAADRELLKGVNREKIKASWVPWTSPRLARVSGYGAGVSAPKWYEHLWHHSTSAQSDEAWAVQITHRLRVAGHIVSTASAIEVIRLARTLAALRKRPRAGFEELREATIACQTFGELLPWHEIERELLLGCEVGEVPADLPLAPLLDDLSRQQKKVKLKPEALEAELSLDLRSESGLARSTLLHRLAALNVPWGRPIDTGRSRGTFREKWTLAWQPEFAIELVEKIVYGLTIETAVSTLISESIAAETRLAALAEMTFQALTAQLPKAVEAGIARMADLATLCDDCAALLSAVPPLVETIRYGQAREVDTEALAAIAERMVTQAAIALPYAARGLDNDEAHRFFTLLPATQRALDLADFDPAVADDWRAALCQLALDDATTSLVSGVALRLCHEGESLDIEAISKRVTQAISPGVSIASAAGFFEGFFTGAGQRLIHDASLRQLVDAWLMTLDDEAYIAHLPLLRRVFSGMDRNERKELLARAIGRNAAAVDFKFAQDADQIWSEHLPILVKLLRMEAADV